jgi:hypothetical protein
MRSKKSAVSVCTLRMIYDVHGSGQRRIFNVILYPRNTVVLNTCMRKYLYLYTEMPKGDLDVIMLVTGLRSSLELNRGNSCACHSRNSTCILDSDNNSVIHAHTHAHTHTKRCLVLHVPLPGSLRATGCQGTSSAFCNVCVYVCVCARARVCVCDLPACQFHPL